MEKRSIHTDNAPKAIGPYSQAIVVNGLVYTSGQIALDPRSGAIVEGGTAREVEQVIANLTEVLKASGSSFADVIRATIYLVDMADFAIVNEAYGRALHGDGGGDERGDGDGGGASILPARSTVQVAALPKGARVEIDLIAIARPQV
jgi:2-iminobutanoate/2-iminopropanoate deaminase